MKKCPHGADWRVVGVVVVALAAAGKSKCLVISDVMVVNIT